MKAMRFATWPLLLIIAAMLAYQAHAIVGSLPSLNASILNYEPVPATPGSLLDVYVQIENSGNTANAVTVEFIDNGPFRLASESDRIKRIERLPGAQTFLLKYQVRVDENAAPGRNQLKVQWSSGNSGTTQSALLPIDVTGSTVALSVEDVQLTPEILNPGSPGKLEFWLRNNAQLRISSGTVKLDLTDIDLVPLGSTNMLRFTDLQAAQNQKFTFTLAPGPAIEPGVYKVPVTLTFQDQTGQQYNQSEYIGVRVGATPDVSVTVDESKITADQTSGEVIVRVTNKGLGEIKFVNMVLGPSDSYELVSGSSERYVGNIDSDDYKTARMQLESTGDSITLPVTVTYMDALNTPYNKTTELVIPVRESESGGSRNYLLFGGLIVLVVAAYFIFRRKRKEK